MAIQSYSILYLPNLSENLGVMFEHAVDIGINPTIFLEYICQFQCCKTN